MKFYYRTRVQANKIKHTGEHKVGPEGPYWLGSVLLFGLTGIISNISLSMTGSWPGYWELIQSPKSCLRPEWGHYFFKWKIDIFLDTVSSQVSDMLQDILSICRFNSNFPDGCKWIKLRTVIWPWDMSSWYWRSFFVCVGQLKVIGSGHLQKHLLQFPAER